MKHKNTTKRTLALSLLVMLMCVAMLVGTTFAWFTDSATSSGNKIQAGTLNIDLLVKDAAGIYQSVKQDKTAIFDYDMWEPGYTEVRNVKVSTGGNLALKYTLSIVPKSSTTPADLKLAEVIDVYYASSEVNVTDRNLTGLTRIGTLKDVLNGVEGTVINDTLIPDQNTEDYATIALKMQESAGNDYQDLSVGEGFDLNLVATQYTYEEDSFDNQYDANAGYPVLVSSVEEIRDVLENGGNLIFNDDITVEDGIQLSVKNDTSIDFNGNTLTGAVASGSIYNTDGPTNLVLSDTKNDDSYSIDGSIVVHEGGGYTQIAAVTAWKPTVTIESGKYTHDANVVLCQLQTSDPNAVGVVINGGTFDGKGNASVVADVIGRVVINDGTFNAHKVGTGAGGCVYLDWGSSTVPSITTINGGIFNAEARIFYVDVNTSYTQKIVVNGGTFNVAEGGSLIEVSSGNAASILVITGGTFNVDPTAYVDTANYNVTNSGSTWTVTAK